MTCDLRIASPEATFSLPPARLGLAYPVEAMADIVAAVGEQTAKYLVYSAARVDAVKMQSFGFLFDVIAKDDLEGRIDDLAHQIASLAPLTHKASKAAIKATRLGETQMAKELGDATFASEDYAEGRRAFQEKRRPVFNGG